MILAGERLAACQALAGLAEVEFACWYAGRKTTVRGEKRLDGRPEAEVQSQ